MGKNSQIPTHEGWDDIRYFLALARTGSLSGASRDLRVEHSTVARRVGQLEEKLSLRLFDRFARGWALTREGEGLLERAEAIEREVMSFRRLAAGADDLAGTVTISAPPILLSHVLLPRLRDLTADHPGLELRLVGERREADLMRAEADIAVRLGRPGEPDLVMQPLGEITYGLYGMPDAVNRPAFDRLYIGFDDTMPGLPQKLWLDEYAAGCRFSLRSNDMGTMLQAALGGFGIALLPDFLARHHSQLTKMHDVYEPPVRPLFLVMHPDVRRSRRVRLAADMLLSIRDELRN